MTRKSTTKALLAVAAVCLVPLALAVPRAVYANIAGLGMSAIVQSYHTAPAFVLVLGLALALPLVAAVLMLARGLVRRSPLTGEAESSTVTPDEESAHVGGHPFIEVQVGGEGIECALLGDMLRIGREVDNDIRIPSSAVHLYHAAIHREDSDDWHITDFSGTPGSGMIVNGRRCVEARLSDGDVIELGPGRLLFHASHA